MGRPWHAEDESAVIDEPCRSRVNVKVWRCTIVSYVLSGGAKVNIAINARTPTRLRREKYRSVRPAANLMTGQLTILHPLRPRRILSCR